MGTIVANIVGPDLWIVLAVVALLFGGSQIPRLARSLGSAKREFEAGLASHAAPEASSEAQGAPDPAGTRRDADGPG
jgi:sec-independent protein translocase protein TatA